MPRTAAITIKPKEAFKVTLKDAEAINEVLLRVTTTEQPSDGDLPGACAAAKDAWLAAFREAVIQKFEAHCVDDDALDTSETMAVGGEGWSGVGLRGPAGRSVGRAQTVGSFATPGAGRSVVDLACAPRYFSLLLTHMSYLCVPWQTRRRCFG